MLASTAVSPATLGCGFPHRVFTGEHAHPSTVPESIVLGSCQWSIGDGITNADEIKAALAAAEAKKRPTKPNN